MISLIGVAVPLMSMLTVGMLAVIFSYLDCQSLFTAVRTWKPFMAACRKDEVLRSRTRQHVKMSKSSRPVLKDVMYHQTPLLRQREREQFKIPRVRLYRVILKEEKRRGGEEINVSKNSIRYQPIKKAKGIRI